MTTENDTMTKEGMTRDFNDTMFMGHLGCENNGKYGRFLYGDEEFVGK